MKKWILAKIRPKMANLPNLKVPGCHNRDRMRMKLDTCVFYSIVKKLWWTKRIKYVFSIFYEFLIIFLKTKNSEKWQKVPIKSRNRKKIISTFLFKIEFCVCSTKSEYEKVQKWSLYSKIKNPEKNLANLCILKREGKYF